MPDWVKVVARLTTERDEARAAEMRAALEWLRSTEALANSAVIAHALSTEAGKGYVSPEEQRLTNLSLEFAEHDIHKLKHDLKCAEAENEKLRDELKEKDLQLSFVEKAIARINHILKTHDTWSPAQMRAECKAHEDALQAEQAEFSRQFDALSKGGAK